MTQPNRKQQQTPTEPRESDSEELIETAVRKRNPYKAITAQEQTHGHGGYRSKNLRKLRTRRFKIDELGPERMQLSAWHRGIGKFVATVEDISAYGLALVVDERLHHSHTFFAGDRLDDITLAYESIPLFKGTGSVRRTESRDNRTVLGVELAAPGIDVSLLHRERSRQSFSSRFQDFIRETEDVSNISTDFRLFIHDVRSYLEALKAFLDTAETALQSEDLLSQNQLKKQYLEIVSAPVVDRMNGASRTLAELVKSLSDDEHERYRRYARQLVTPLLIEGPFARRAFEKPLGYPGDYEVMNMLYRDHAEGDSLFAKVLNIHGTQEPASVANINRLEYLSDIGISVCERHTGTPVRFASIGCGPAREVASLLQRRPDLGSHLSIALIDQEPKAIEYCEKTLSPLTHETGAKFEFVRESIRTLISNKQLSRVLGARHFIYSAGLFDYLNTRTFQALLHSLYEALIPGGTLAVGNVGTHNPSRQVMEYYLDWFLIHRSEEELLRLARSLAPTPASVRVDAEKSGVNLFLLITK
jgi:extracellular factor (EF) 3-hydroxypalmitic acid methyl ester biosynthesis protein